MIGTLLYQNGKEGEIPMSEGSKCSADANENAQYCTSCGANVPVTGGSLNGKKAHVPGGKRIRIKSVIIAASVTAGGTITFFVIRARDESIDAGATF